MAAPAVHKRIEVELALIHYEDQLLTDLAWPIVRTAKHHDANPFSRRRSLPGVGTILTLVRL